MVLGFALHQGCIEFARAEVDVVVGASGAFSGPLYVVDVALGTSLSSFSRLAFC